MMIDIKGKNALVTGSSRGIGQQIAKGLANLGCNVIVHGRTNESCAKTIELLREYDVNVYSVFGELSEEKEVLKIVDQVNNLNIKIDILYNNAAIMTPYYVDYWEHTWEDWTNTFKVNIMAMFTLCKAFVPKMIENNFGRVINTSSGIMHQPELAPYSASKWAVNKLTDDLAFKVKDTNVRINTLDPGWIKTDMGGEHADHNVEDVLPGVLEAAIIDSDGPNGVQFSAINHNL